MGTVNGSPVDAVRIDRTEDSGVLHWRLAGDWREIGTKQSFRDDLAPIFGISVRGLEGEEPSNCNFAEGMS